MGRLKFEMWKAENRRGVMSEFTDGNGFSTKSWWNSPMDAIDHVGREYLESSHRHPNVSSYRHVNFIKQRYKEEMARLKALQGEDKT